MKHSVKSTFHKQFTPTHQKGRQVPINLQPLVNEELKKLLDEKHIKKINSCSDKNFISPIVITIKRDIAVKLALDSKILNKSIHKTKYQMPNIDNLIDTIQQNLITTASQETAYFSTLDLKYAYSSSNHICHVTGGGGGGGPDPPPYKNSHHRKTDFLLVKASFLVKFRQPERSSCVKLAGET